MERSFIKGTGTGNLSQAKLRSRLRWLWRDRHLYFMLIPVILFYLIFCYAPMGGLVIAFKDFRFNLGIDGSPWVGFKYFDQLFNMSAFWTAFRNTLLLNVYSLIVGFPVPIILAILFNEIGNLRYKRVLQQVIYLPHFFSWVILGGMIVNILSPNTGFVNSLLSSLTGQSIYFMTSEAWWPWVFVLSGIWKEAGWGTIIYLAAITGIDPEMYEAAILDGAGKWKQIRYITLPSIMPTILIMLILRMGSMMTIGFEQVYVLQNGAVRKVSDVISTLVYRIGIEGAQYSLTTAIGIFQSVIAVVLVLTANKLANRFQEGGGIF